MRRSRWLLLPLVGIVLSGCLSSVRAAVTGPAATTWRLNSAHDGIDGTSTGRPPLKLAWSAGTQGAVVGENEGTEQTPLTDGSRVYSFERVWYRTTLISAYRLSDGHLLWGPIVIRDYGFATLAGSRLLFWSNLAQTPTLRAFDTATGRLLWAASPHEDPGAAPLVAGGLGYLGDSVFDPTTGKQIGLLPYPSPSHNYNQTTIVGGYLYASDVGTVWRVNLSTRKLDWVYQQNLSGGEWYQEPPLVVNNRVYAYDEKANPMTVMVLDASTGKLIQHVPSMPEAFVGANLVLRVLAADQRHVQLQSRTMAGKVNWTWLPTQTDKYGTPYVAATVPAVANGVIYEALTATSNTPGLVVALNGTTGKLMWSAYTKVTPTVDATQFGQDSIAVLNNSVVVPTDQLQTYEMSK